MVVPLQPANPISAARYSELRACCDLVEGVLTNDEHVIDWETLEPAFLNSMFQDLELGNNELSLDWSSLPTAVCPDSHHCQLDETRAHHKRCQLQALLAQVLPLVDKLEASIAPKPVRVVEFGSGSGHLGLLLAYLRPSCHVTLVERKEYACQQATRRCDEAGLSNVDVRRSSIHEFADSTESRFDFGISLHSCGVLTDAALALCVQERAAFLLCPCCYGQTASHLPDDYLPRSQILKPLQCMKCGEPGTNAELPKTTTATTTTTTTPRRQRRKSKKFKAPPFYRVARAADCTTTDIDSANFVIAKRSMQLVDADRLLWAQEFAYQVEMSTLRPLSVTPKNNVIIGMPLPKMNSTHLSPPELIPLIASAKENAEAEAGEQKKTGQAGFRVTSNETTILDTAEPALVSPIVRTISASSSQSGTNISVDDGDPLVPPCAYHILNAFTNDDLEKLDKLRLKIPLDTSRPTCPRRFLTEKPIESDDNRTTLHREDGWVGSLIDKTVASWKLPHQFVSLPWFRYLEYTEPGGHMARHSDGSNVDPRTGAKSVATMLIYLSTCTEGGETTLYQKLPKDKSAGRQKNKDSTLGDGKCDVIESVRPVYNSALIFPHRWPHSGDPVIQDPKIALRVDLAWAHDTPSSATGAEEWKKRCESSKAS